MTSQVQSTLRRVLRMVRAQRELLAADPKLAFGQQPELVAAVLQTLEEALAELQQNLGRSASLERDLELAGPYFRVAGCLEHAIRLVREIQDLGYGRRKQTQQVLLHLDECLNYLPGAQQPLLAAPAQPVDRIRLLQILKNYFNDDDLWELSFYLKVDYDDLAGQSKRRKAMSLIEHLERRGQIQQLEEILRQLRPNAFK